MTHLSESSKSRELLDALTSSPSKDTLVTDARHWKAWADWARANDMDWNALILADQALKVRCASHFPQVHAALAFVFAHSSFTNAALSTAPFV
jgi:hypothetical protein